MDENGSDASLARWPVKKINLAVKMNLNRFKK